MNELRRVRIGIIGAGNMGEALINGLIAAGVSGARLLVVEADPATRRRLASRRLTCSTTERVVTTCDAILLAVKPQDMAPVLARLSAWLVQPSEAARSTARGTSSVGRPAPADTSSPAGIEPARSAARPLIISIAAGLTTASLQRALGRCPLIRVMPNLPAKVGQGITALAAGRWATGAHRRLASAIFESVGEVVELPERSFDTVTAISGSGPAYFFLIFQALRDAGLAGGLSKAVAQRLAIQTALGSALLAKQSRDELETMIVQVASKKGTTEAALNIFRRRGLAKLIQAGVRAAARRSKELTRCLS